MISESGHVIFYIIYNLKYDLRNSSKDQWSVLYWNSIIYTLGKLSSGDLMNTKENYDFF